MSESTNLPATTEEKKTAAARTQRQVEEPKELDDLHTERGDTKIADDVVQKMAGIATRGVPGVYAMGNTARRAISGLAQRIPVGGTGPDVTGGVSVQKGERETAVEVSVVLEYGASIVQVSQQIREDVIRAVEHSTGLTVVSVDIHVSDVHLPEDDQDQSSQQRDDLR